MDELDHGVRCDRHVGEVFRVRCADCDREAAEAAAERGRPTSTRYEPGSDCPKHNGYPLPCDSCAREADRRTRADAVAVAGRQ